MKQTTASIFTAISVLLGLLILVSCKPTTTEINADQLTQEINQFVDNWHKMAATADTAFFEMIAENGVYLGTDTKEVWSKQEFEKFALPYFRKGKAWNFTPYDRNVYMNESGSIAWFDERLDTWMGTCRGSGVVTKASDDWQLLHYNLSVSIPNEKIEQVIDICANEINTLEH